MRSRIKHGVCAVALIVITAMVWLGLKDQAPQIGLTNDNLTALFHVHQIREQGPGQLLRINWARIPSLLPDYVIAGFADQLGGRLTEKMTLSCLLQAAAGVGALLLLPQAVAPRRSTGSILLHVTSYGIPLTLSPGFRQLAIMASLPINHGGNWINTSIFFVLVLYVLRQGGKADRRWTAAALPLACVSTFSNRLFLLTALLPLLLIRLAPNTILRYRKRLPWLSPLTRWSLAGGAAGCLLYLIVPHQCSDNLVGTTNLMTLVAVLRAQKAALVLLLTPCVLWIGTRLTQSRWQRSQPDGEARRLLLGDSLLVMAVASALAYPWIARGETDGIYLRYLLTPMLLSPSLVALTLAPFWRLGGLLGLAMASSHFALATPVNRWGENPADRALLLALPGLKNTLCPGSDCVLLASNPPFNTLRLSLELSGTGIDLMEVSGHGDPLIFWMSRSDFYSDRTFAPEDRARGLRASPLLATGAEQTASLLASLGPPIGRLPLDTAGHVVLIHADSQAFRKKAVAFFANQSQLPFCVPNNIRQPLLQLRSMARALAKR